MGKNIYGGNKQKKKKQVRNKFQVQHKPQNIPRPCAKEGTYYGKVLRTYGSKFEVYIFHLDIKIDSKVRGSRQMKYKCPRISIIKNPYVIVEYNKDYYKFGTIMWVYKEWEYKHLINAKIIYEIDDELNIINTEDGFVFEEKKKKKVEKEDIDVYSISEDQLKNLNIDNTIEKDVKSDEYDFDNL